MFLAIDRWDYRLCIHLCQAKRQMVTVLLDLQYFGVKNFTGTNWTMKVTEYCSLVWIPEYSADSEPWILPKLVLQVMKTQWRKRKLNQGKIFPLCEKMKSVCLFGLHVWILTFIKLSTSYSVHLHCLFVCLFVCVFCFVVVVKPCVYAYCKPWWQGLNSSP